MSEHYNDPDLREIVARVAIKFGRTFRGFAEADDIRQELWLWVLSHGKAVDRWAEEEKGQRKLVYSLNNVAKAYGVQQKAASSGYTPDDVAFYGKAEVRELLEMVFDRTKWEAPPQADEGRRGGRPANEGNGWVATLSDVSRAVDKLDAPDREAVELFFGRGEAAAYLAEVWDVSTSTAYARIDRAVKKVWRELGGARPNQGAVHPDLDGDGCECLHVWKGRRAMSNAAARAAQEKHYDE